MNTGQDLNEAISEHQHLVKVLRSSSHDDDRREAKKQAAELKTLRRKKVRDWLPAKSAPEAYPGVELGDSLYIHHPERGPIAVKVHAQGRHGITATDSEGNWHRTKWQHVLGAKQRLSQRLTLVDQGEDGAITEDESGQRRYVAIDPEAREDQPLRKSQPTAAQIEAGNYRKDHQRFQGLDISIENPKGSVRAGTDPDGKPWRITMRHAYGYIRGTCGVDKDHVDCYLGPNPDASHAYVVHQRQAGKWSRYDEDKVMLGFDSAADAKAAYLAQYDDPRFFGDLTAMPMADFKRKALATRKRPHMIKGQVLFLKAEVKGHTRRLANGKIVTVKPYRDKRGHQANEHSGELFGATPARPHAVHPTPAPTPAPTPRPAPAPEPTPAPKPRKLTKIEKLRASMADLFATIPDPKPEPTPAPKPDPKPEPTPAPKPDPKPEPTPAPKPEPERPGTLGNPLGLTEAELGFVPRPDVPMDVRVEKNGYRKLQGGKFQLTPWQTIAEKDHAIRYLAQSTEKQNKAKAYQRTSKYQEDWQMLPDDYVQAQWRDSFMQSRLAEQTDPVRRADYVRHESSYMRETHLSRVRTAILAGKAVPDAVIAAHGLHDPAIRAEVFIPRTPSELPISAILARGEAATKSVSATFDREMKATDRKIEKAINELNAAQNALNSNLEYIALVRERSQLSSDIHTGQSHAEFMTNSEALEKLSNQLLVMNQRIDVIKVQQKALTEPVNQRQRELKALQAEPIKLAEKFLKRMAVVAKQKGVDVDAKLAQFPVSIGTAAGHDTVDMTDDEKAVCMKSIQDFMAIAGTSRVNLSAMARIKDTPRAFYREPGLINIGDSRSQTDLRHVIFHEMAHSTDPMCAEACWKFVLHRRTSPELKKLNDITGNSFFDEDELAFEDRFISAYVGKIYRADKPESAPLHTEVLSMGLENFSSPEKLADFYQADREHFYLVMACLSPFNSEYLGDHERAGIAHVLPD